MNLIKGVHHVCMKCCSSEDYENEIRFYRDVLELPVLRTWNEPDDIGTMFRAGNEIIELFNTVKDRLPQGAIRHFALETDNVDECVRRVREAGLPVIMEPVDIVIPSDPAYPLRIAFVNGPLGEEIEFLCERS